MKRMSPEKSKQLIDTYPELFSDLPEMNCMRLFGFDCGNGWFDLLKDLITKIRAHCESPDFQPYIDLLDQPLSPKVAQVKEKYGTLRFYLDLETEYIEKLIEEAEDKSAIICEICGNTGMLREHHRWLSVRCDDCWNRHIS